MYRGTTPTVTIHCDLDAEQFEVLWITFCTRKVNTYAPTKEIEITKELGEEGVEVDGQDIIVHLTQEDTLELGSLSPGNDQRVEVQVRGKTADGRAYASNIMTALVCRILKDGVI